MRTLFGEQLHALTFGKAIQEGWLTDYRVVIVGVDDETIRELIHKRRLVQTDVLLALPLHGMEQQDAVRSHDTPAASRKRP